MYQLIDGVYVWGEPESSAVEQAKRCKADASAVHVALMGDHHKGYGVPIGGVVAYRNAVSPSGVGYDIGCGNKAVLTDMPGQVLRDNIKTIMDDIWRIISFGVGRKNNEKVDHPLFQDDLWKESGFGWLFGLRDMANEQLGTIGSGNHYVDLFTDEQDRVWIGVHFGSRGLGHKIATHFLQLCNASDDMDAPPVVIPLDHYFGQDYMRAMELAGHYAYAGRDWVCNKVASAILGASILDEVHNHHNYAWVENHNPLVPEDKLVVVRKGATPARPGQRGFVGGTMTENAVILEGVKSQESVITLYSTVHGAGRVMGRMEAKGKFDRKTGEMKRAGKVSQEMMDADVSASGIELRGAGLDESSFCYKRLPEVLRNQGTTVRILHTLKPVGVAMAGAFEYDPFKD